MVTWIRFPLVISLFAMLIAQVLKIPIHWLLYKRFDIRLMFSTGRLPSSHSAMVTSLATEIGLSRGWNDDLFAIAAIFALIVMYDALGIRRHAGKQATVLNQLVKDIQENVYTMTRIRQGKDNEELKEVLGHEPLEVLSGVVLGIVIGALPFAF